MEKKSNQIFKIIPFFCLFSIYSMTFAFPDKQQESEHYKCGTFTQDSIKKKILSKHILTIPTGRPELPFQDTSASGNFIIHYTTTGEDAVPTDDKDGNGVPDFVDSAAIFFDYSYKVEVEEMGFKSPIDDFNGGGTKVYDIYMWEIGIKPKNDNNGGYYGLTNSEKMIPPKKTYNRYTSYIIIDNNFSPLDSIYNDNGKNIPSFYRTGYDGLKVTAAHEFHHAIQDLYGDLDGTHSVHEMSSIWMESRVFPYVKDYLQFMRGLFTNIKYYSFANGDTQNGYRWGIFWEFVHHNFGDSLLLRTWELVEDGNPGFGAMDKAFNEKGSSLENEWHNFLPWMYYTGARHIDGKFFTDGKLMPELKFEKEQRFQSPALGDTSLMVPYELRAYRTYLPEGIASTDDTLDILLVNTDTKGARNQTSQQKELSFSVSDYITTYSKNVPDTKYYYNIDLLNGTFRDSIFFYKGVATKNVDSPFPSPFLFNVDEAIYFPVPENALFYDNAELFIYAADMIGIYSGKLPIVPFQDKKVICWKDIPDKFSSGVYIYSVKYKDESSLGKFAVIAH
jgi:hypothetical protein